MEYFNKLSDACREKMRKDLDERRASLIAKNPEYARLSAEWEQRQADQFGPNWREKNYNKPMPVEDDK